MELHEKGIKIQDLSDWLVHVEQSLASEQPLKEKSVEVKEQKVIRKLLHEDIQVHQQPVRQCVEDTEQFLKILRHRGSHPDTNHLRLRDGQSDLRGRYDAVLTQSSNRQKTLTRAIEDLQRLEADFKEFQDWLQGAERKMDTMEGNVTIQLDPLNAQEAHHKEFGEDIKDQKGHLQFLKKSVQTYTNLAKIYSQSLDEFRIRVPLQNSRAFQETPETQLLVGQLRDVTYRFDKLRVRYLKHVRLFEEFVAKDTFSEKVSSASTWLGDARTTLKDMRSEPIVAAKEVILRQIERLVMFHQDVITHASDIQNVKTNYKDLIISQPAVQRTIDDIVESIRILKTDAEDFLEKLQMALANTQLVHEKLDKLITWLDEVEEQHRLEKGALTSFRRETILEGIENNENLHKYISTHQDDIDAINDVAFKLCHIIEPPKAKTIRDKLSEVNNRYQNICDATIRLRNMLRGLVDGVNDFESRVNRLEDWELQLIQTLSSKGTEQLEDAKQQVERQRPALKHILHIGEQLIKEPGFNDTSHFKDILANVRLNWETLEDSLAQR
ncbi:microtubule-actin cross-linking factor 1, isoforms 1/2/3/4-like [Diadema antillarum]|uniref:microtubule-actin cross-linking factor 1, isoforms 1/2/3/4-like n=1 Tax=Diadema antillarum TaxID=105358 RepID=UPI003A8898B0